MSKKEIIICKKCSGQGVISHDELVDYHKREYAEWTEACKMCQGSGMLVQTTTIEYAPHKPQQPRPR